MWRVALALGLAACGFSGGGGGGAGGDANPNSRAVVDDSAATFEAGSASDGVITARGTLEPDAFVLGGLHARGFVGTLVGATTTWDALTPMLGPPAGERYGELPVTDWGLGWPVDLGLAATSGDNFTVVYDGEIYLAGPTTLQVAVDDYAFVDIAPDGVTFQTFHVQFNDAPLKTMTFTPAAPGWYPIRAAMSEHNVNARMVVSVVSGGTTALIDASLLRARVTTAPGLIVTGFQYGLTLGTLGSAVDPGAIDHQWAALPDYDLESPAGSGASIPLNGSAYSLRYAGQVLVDAADAETFTVAVGSGSAEAFRIAVDGTEVASARWPSLTDQVTSAPVALTGGWHDLVVDYNHFGTAAGGLDVERNGATIASDHLRPAIVHGQLASTMVVTGGTVMDSTPEVTTVMLAAPNGAMIDSVDWGFQLTGDRTNLTATCAYAGTTDADPVPAAPDYPAQTYDALIGRTSFTGHTIGAAAPWTVTVAKIIPGGSNPTVGYSAVATTYHGGPQIPFAPVWSYTATPRMVPGLTAITGATVTADLRGATLKIEVRTAADATAIATAPWIDVTTAPPPAAAAAVLEYRVTITGDGWSLPSISRVEIDYAVAAS